MLLALTITLFAQSPGDIIITEIMQNPNDQVDPAGEWFEILNTTTSDIDINGWQISDDGTDVHVIANGGPLIVPAGEFLVLANDTDRTVNGDLQGAHYEYGLDFVMGNNSDEVVLSAPIGGFTEITRVNYDNGATFPDPNGASMVYTGGINDDINFGVRWAISTIREGLFAPSVGGTDDLGSPGVAGSDADASLPVSLTAFSASASDGQVKMRWSTASEVNNLGFEIWRSDELNGEYTMKASYINDPALQGQFTSSTQADYAWNDRFVINGNSYYYKLADIDVNGVRRLHGPLMAMPQAAGSDLTTIDADAPEAFKLHGNYPNPFNPTTRLQFDIPSTREELAPLKIEIYNTLGQKVKTLFDGQITPGVHEVDWDATTDAGNSVPAGVYIAIMKSRQTQQTIKMTLVK